MNAKEWLINKHPEMEAEWQQTSHDYNWTALKMEEFAEYKVNLLNKPAVITPLLSDKELEEYVWEEYPFKLSQKDVDMNTETYKHYLSAVELAKWARDNCNGL